MHSMAYRGWLQVQALRGVLLLAVEDIFLRLLEVLVRHLHPPLPQRHEPRLGADGFDVGTCRRNYRTQRV